jgi:hypothetical protein
MEHEKNLKCCELCNKFYDRTFFESSICKNCYTEFDDLENSGDCAISICEFIDLKKNEKTKNSYYLTCPRINVVGNIKKISTKEFDSMSKIESDENEIHFDLTNLSNNYNSGNPNCEFNSKQIYENFSGDELEIIKFYENGLTKKLFVIVE